MTMWSEANPPNSMNEASTSAASPLFSVFLSHNSQDKATVERLAEKLKRVQIEPWLDKWQLTPGGDWQDELAAGLRASSACAVFVGPHGLGSWEALEYKLAVDRMAKDRAFRCFLVLLPGVPEPFDTSALPPFLVTRTWVDLRQGIEDSRALQMLVNAVKGLALGPERPIEPRSDVCPYRGLLTFHEEHAGFFFGRDGDTQRLIEKMKTQRFLAVLGSSGSGKSSLVRAGLVPALRKGGLPGSGTLTIEVFTPGAQPLTALAANLVRLFPQSAMQQTLDQLVADERTLHLAVALGLAGRPAGDRVVLVVDQCEEAFTLCRSEAERAQFFANLLYAAFMPDGLCAVVLTMRADFYPKCAAYPDLSARVAAHQVLVGPLQGAGERQAIEQPAWSVGLELEPGLVETIQDDVENQPGALPLLEHALLETWQRRSGQILTLEGYRASGGVLGAVAKRAEAQLASLGPAEQELALRVLTRLVRVAAADEEGTDTRQRLDLSELDERSRAVVQPFVDAHLLTTSLDETTKRETLQVAHEALIRNWERLKKRLDEDRKFLLWRQRLALMLDEWQRSARDPSTLLRGTSLDQARRFARERRDDLNGPEREFIKASEVAAKRPKRWAAAAAAAALLVTGAAAGWFFWIRSDAYQVRQVLARGTAMPPMVPPTWHWAQALAIAGKPSEATAAVRAIKDPSHRASGLGAVALILAKMGHTNEAFVVAREAGERRAFEDIVEYLGKAGRVDEMLAAIREVKDGSARPLLLLTAAQTLARMKRLDQARNVLKETLTASEQETQEVVFVEALVVLVEVGDAGTALSAARNVQRKNTRLGALAKIASALAESGQVDEALAVLRGLDVPESDAKEYLAGPLVKAGRPAEAIATVRDLKDPMRRDRAAAKVAVALAESGKASDALGIARLIYDTHNRSEAFLGVVKALAARGEIDGALALARERTVYADDRDEALAWAAETFAKIGKREAALTTAREIKKPFFAYQVYLAVAEAAAQAGERREAKLAVDQALSTVREIEPDKNTINDQTANEAFFALADALARLGFPDEALSAARSIKERTDGSKALVPVVRSLVKAGRTDEATKVADEALAATRGVHAYDATVLFKDLAALVGGAGRTDQVLAAARQLEPEARGEAFVGIGDALAGAGRVSDAKRVAAAAVAAASTIAEDSQRSRALAGAAALLARLHLYRQALETAERCSSSEDKLSSYAAILLEHTKERNPGLVKLLQSDQDKSGATAR